MTFPTVRIGADPEIFVLDQHKKFVSAFGLITGDKQNPTKVEKGAVQVDGMALEFNIDPANYELEFVTNVQTVMAILGSMVPGYELAPVPVAHFTQEYLDAQPDEAKILGCEPDYNAYTGGVNIKPDAKRPMRTASGHVHIGWTNGVDTETPDHNEACRAVTQQMDVVLGLPSLFYDADTERREMYGKAGCYRRKPYGAEYRTLSNAWLLSAERMAWVYRNAVKGMQALFEGNAFYQQVKDVPEIINTSDKKRAEKIIRDLNLEVVA